MNILEKALKILKDKENDHRDYGPAVENLETTAHIVSLLIRKKLTKEDLAMIYVIQKLVRESYNHKEDNLIDAAGYLSIFNDCVND